MKLELSNMKKILLLGLLISCIYISSCKKDECKPSDNIINSYDSINQIYIDAFIIDTTRKIKFKKYKSDSIIMFSFKEKTTEYLLTNSNNTLYNCSTSNFYRTNINYYYYNQNNETLIISQNRWNYSIKFRNISCSFWNGNLKTKTYQYDTISFSNNVFYDVFRSNEAYQTPSDFDAYYNTKYGFLRLRLSLYDIWDIKL